MPAYNQGFMVTTLKSLINEYTRLDIMTFFNRKLTFIANFFANFIVEIDETLKDMTTVCLTERPPLDFKTTIPVLFPR